MTLKLHGCICNRISGIAVLTISVMYPVAAWSQDDVMKHELAMVDKVNNVAMANLIEAPVLEKKIINIDGDMFLKNKLHSGSGGVDVSEAKVSENSISEVVLTRDELAAVRPLPVKVIPADDTYGGLADGVGNIAGEISSDLIDEDNINSRRRKVNAEGVAMLRRMLWMTLFYSGSK